MNIISNELNLVLNYFLNITGDLGIAIILLTALVRLLLMPLSFRQKMSMQSQQNLSKGLEEIKNKYKNNKAKLDSETKKYYEQNAKGMLGSLVGLLQLPIIFSLYNVVLKMPLQVGTALVPWVASLKMTDNYFVIPVLYIITVLSPNLLSYVPFLKVAAQAKISKTNIIITSIMSALITFKAPVALGLYLITSSLFSVFEEVIFRLYSKSRKLAL
jgi:YidC/Oxa1 family membrane protein insertase